MTDINRRTVVLGAAWSVPVIMAAVAVPLAAASTTPEANPLISCTRIDGKGQPMYNAVYVDGTSLIVDQGTVNSDKEMQAKCRDKGPLS